MLGRFDVVMLQHMSLGRIELLSGTTKRESERRMPEVDRMAAKVADDDARTCGPPDAAGYSPTSAIIVRGLARCPTPATSTQLSYHCATPAFGCEHSSEQVLTSSINYHWNFASSGTRRICSLEFECTAPSASQHADNYRLSLCTPNCAIQWPRW